MHGVLGHLLHCKAILGLGLYLYAESIARLGDLQSSALTLCYSCPRLLPSPQHMIVMTYMDQKHNCLSSNLWLRSQGTNRHQIVYVTVTCC